MIDFGIFVLLALVLFLSPFYFFRERLFKRCQRCKDWSFMTLYEIREYRNGDMLCEQCMTHIRLEEGRQDRAQRRARMHEELAQIRQEQEASKES